MNVRILLTLAIATFFFECYNAPPTKQDLYPGTVIKKRNQGNQNQERNLNRRNRRQRTIVISQRKKKKKKKSSPTILDYLRLIQKYNLNVEKHNNIIEDLEFYTGETMKKEPFLQHKSSKKKFDRAYKKFSEKNNEMLLKIELLEQYAPIVQKAYERENEQREEAEKLSKKKFHAMQPKQFIVTLE